MQCMGFSLQWLLLLQSTGFRCMGFSSCSTQAQQLWLSGPKAWPQSLWPTQLLPRIVESSWTRDRTHVPCTGRWILIHGTTREVPIVIFFFFFFGHMSLMGLISQFLQSLRKKQKNINRTEKREVVVMSRFLFFNFFWRP